MPVRPAVVRRVLGCIVFSNHSLSYTVLLCIFGKGCFGVDAQTHPTGKIQQHVPGKHDEALLCLETQRKRVRELACFFLQEKERLFCVKEIRFFDERGSRAVLLCLLRGWQERLGQAEWRR